MDWSIGYPRAMTIEDTGRFPKRTGVARPLLLAVFLICHLAACGPRDDGSRGREDDVAVEDRAVAGLVVDGSRAPAERTYWFHGGSPVARYGSGFVFRRNNASLVAWSDVLTGRARPAKRILVHVDAHSDAHPSRVCTEPSLIRAYEPGAVETYAESLPISSFVMPALHYGWIDEVYWVQPPIPAFRGPVESYSFGLGEEEGWIRPRPRTGAAHVSDDEWKDVSRRSLDGDAVGRSAELDFVYRLPMHDWSGDDFRFHLLSAAQFDSLFTAGLLPEAEWVFDVDLDYFGSAGPLRGYGLLEVVSPAGVAQSSRGQILPVFQLGTESRSRDLARIRSWLRGLGAVVWSLSESPDHAFRDTPAAPRSRRRAAFLRLPPSSRGGSTE
ncbi:MAG: UPF0489 family protein [Candidatus Eisenbacteria bacterium]